MTGPSTRLYLVQLASTFVARVLPWALAAASFWFFHRSAVALSQESPNISPYLQVLASANRARSFAFLIGVLGILYGLVQRELRRRMAAEFSQRLQALQSPESTQKG